MSARRPPMGVTAVAGLLLGAALFASCAKKTVDNTSLEVRVTSELRVPDAIDDVRVTVTATHTKEYDFPLVAQGSKAPYALPLSLAFTPNGDLSQPFTVDVTGLLAGKEVVFREFVVQGFAMGKASTLNVLLSARCQDLHCVTGGATCDVPECGVLTFSPSVPASTPDGGAAGGTDAGSMDASGGVGGGGAGGGGAGSGGVAGSAGGAAGGGGGAAGAAGADAGTDVAPPCTTGQTGTCGDKLGAQGPCAAGTTTCTNGVWGPCSKAPAVFDTCIIGNDDMCTGVPVSDVAEQHGFLMPNPASTGLPHPASYTRNADGTVTDNVTGLLWEGTDSALNALPAAVALCAGKGGGWRLPTMLELVSVVDVTIPPPGPTLNPAFQSVVGGLYWTSSNPISLNTGAGLAIDFSYGVTQQLFQNTGEQVRCVRPPAGIKCYPKRFQVVPGNLISDVATGLTWQRTVTSDDNLLWSDAKAVCTALGTGWRLPSVNELMTIVDLAHFFPTADPTAFPAVPGKWYWTSSPQAHVSDGAWAVRFDLGLDSYLNVGTSGNARCVR